MSNPKLEPCPFCGGAAVLITRNSDRYQRSFYSVGCESESECLGHWVNHPADEDKDAQVARWNKQWLTRRNDFLQGQIEESHKLIDGFRTSSEELSRRLSELLAITNEMEKVCDVWDFAAAGGGGTLKKFSEYKNKWNAH